MALATQRYILGRSDGVEFRPELARGAFLYDCDGPPNTLVDLALGRDVPNCSPAELGARSVEIVDAAYRSARSGKLEGIPRERALSAERDLP